MLPFHAACAMGDTVDARSLKDGYAAEAVATGEACGRNYLVTVSEKNSVGFLYDASDITNPKLVQVFHLSPASETKSAVVAYEERTLGEIDSESILFFEEDESPSGKPAILFAGAFSTTTSYWEFDCDPADLPVPMEPLLNLDTDIATASSEPTAAPATSSAFLMSGSLAAATIAATAVFITM